MGGLFENLSGAKGLRAQGANQQRIDEFNAQVAEQEGKAALVRSEFDQQRQAEEAARTKSKLQAQVGAAGGGASPVAIDITREQESESELEQLLIGFEGQVLKQRSESKAALSRLQGKLAKQAGKSAARRANVSFGLQLAGLAAGLGSFGGGGAGAGAGSPAGVQSLPGTGSSGFAFA